MSGAVLGLVSWGYGAKTGQSIPTSLYLGLLVGAALIAGFLAWRDLYRQQAQERPNVYALLDWRGSDCYEPFLVMNASDVGVQHVEISTITVGEYHATFDVVSYLSPHSQLKLWPKIDGIETRNNHPNISKFILMAQAASYPPSGSRAVTRPLKDGIELPFEISYGDMSGNVWKTKAKLIGGGSATKWGAGRITIETVRVE